MRSCINLDRYHLAFLFTILILGTGHGQITVAAASSLQPVMERLKEEFSQRTGTEIRTVYGASGKLTAQIRHGAPYDVFVSADMNFPDSLYKWGFSRHPPRPYAKGRLVLWTLTGLDLEQGIQILESSEVRKIAIADPENAPFGREAVMVLRKAGLYDQVLPKLVRGQNIGQVNQYILNGNVEIGFTAKSVVLAPEMKGKGRWVEVDSALYDRITHGALVSHYGWENNPTASAHFLRFLHSGRAGQILRQYGYDAP